MPRRAGGSSPRCRLCWRCSRSPPETEPSLRSHRYRPARGQTRYALLRRYRSVCWSWGHFSLLLRGKKKLNLKPILKHINNECCVYLFCLLSAKQAAKSPGVHCKTTSRMSEWANLGLLFFPRLTEFHSMTLWTDMLSFIFVIEKCKFHELRQCCGSGVKTPNFFYFIFFKYSIRNH